MELPHPPGGAWFQGSKCSLLTPSLSTVVLLTRPEFSRYPLPELPQDVAWLLAPPPSDEHGVSALNVTPTAVLLAIAVASPPAIYGTATLRPWR